MDKTVRVYVPKHTTIFYVILAVLLIPWIFDLAQNLPSRHVTTHWDALWVGFDCMILISILTCIWLMIKGSIWLIVSASALATLLLVDVWVDVLTARPGRETRLALVFGVFEVTLSVLTYRMVYHVIHQSTTDQTLRLTSRK